MEKFTKLSDELLGLPEDIKVIQLDLLDLTERSLEISDKINQIESSIQAEINSEADSAGKKIYTNDVLRRAEFIERSANDNELSFVKVDFQSIQRDISEKKIELERISNSQRNIRSVLTFIGEVGK